MLSDNHLQLLTLLQRGQHLACVVNPERDLCMLRKHDLIEVISLGKIKHRVNDEDFFTLCKDLDLKWINLEDKREAV